MPVDISKTKSMWFGQSEKIIKDIFDRYRSRVKQAQKTRESIPILLLNEADAVICKRRETEGSNLAQTENAMQNIILEEMEKLEGILIATTNLTQNMDKAFERRFLFKVEFEKPCHSLQMTYEISIDMNVRRMAFVCMKICFLPSENVYFYPPFPQAH
jgi:SpoVK/Ycf46/Vps4 family AAA+-type ATPase